MLNCCASVKRLALMDRSLDYWWKGVGSREFSDGSDASVVYTETCCSTLNQNVAPSQMGLYFWSTVLVLWYQQRTKRFVCKPASRLAKLQPLAFTLPKTICTSLFYWRILSAVAICILCWFRRTGPQALHVFNYHCSWTHCMDGYNTEC